MSNPIKLPPLPKPSDTELRARDLEIVRVVREAAANFCDDDYHTENGWGTTTIDRRCAAGIRALEFTHG